MDRWIDKIKRCEYLAEEELKALCDYVSTDVFYHVPCHSANLLSNLEQSPRAA